MTKNDLLPADRKPQSDPRSLFYARLIDPLPRNPKNYGYLTIPS